MDLNRELTQLISVAKYYLDSATSVQVPNEELALTVLRHHCASSEDKAPHSLSSLDVYSAHLGSCATRLATIHEILAGGTKKAWTIAYPSSATISVINLASAKSDALEILLRDYVGHAEDDPEKPNGRPAFRKAALENLTFEELGNQLRSRYEILVAELEGFNS